jgi:excisionase family DNA binding protein
MKHRSIYARCSQASNPTLMHMRELAEVLVSRVTAIRLVRSGQLPGLRVGSDWRVRREDLEKWIAKQKVGPRLVPERRRNRTEGQLPLLVAQRLTPTEK